MDTLNVLGFLVDFATYSLLAGSIFFLWHGFTAAKQVSVNAGEKQDTRVVNDQSRELTIGRPKDVVGVQRPAIDALRELVDQNRELFPKPLFMGRALSRTAASLAMSNIELLVQQISRSHDAQPHLFGVNKGGSLVANWIGHRLALHEKYLVKCDWNVGYQRAYVETREVDGPIVILDDLSRTGDTLRSIKSYIVDTYPRSTVYCMVLAVARSSSSQTFAAFDKSSIIDYSAWYTDDIDLLLPWSSESSEIIEADDFFDDDEMDQVAGRIESR